MPWDTAENDSLHGLPPQLKIIWGTAWPSSNDTIASVPYRWKNQFVAIGMQMFCSPMSALYFCGR